MLKLFGALFLMVGAAGLGFGASAQLHARVITLHKLLVALEQMERELSFRLTPIPELLKRLSGEDSVGRFFAGVHTGLSQLGNLSLGDIWNDALEEETDLLLGDEEQQIMRSLGDVIGKYDADGQRAALSQAIDGLERCRTRAQEEWERLGRVYRALGLGAGAMLVILLL